MPTFLSFMILSICLRDRQHIILSSPRLYIKPYPINHMSIKKMEGIQHKFINVNGLNMHIAEKGEGPLVLFLHGFPELWYSWRHQIVYLADHGYRAVAPDLRGYGQTTGAPLNDHTKFTIPHVVGDLIGLLDAITNEGEKVFVVGHDWGALIAWNLCLFRPDRVKALFNMSVAFQPWNPDGNLVEVVRRQYGDDYYIVRFQKPGEIEAEFAKLMSYETFMKKFLTLRDPGPLYFPKGKGFPHSPPGVPVILPPWLSEQDIEYYASQIEKAGGITGGLNYYRALPLSWELTSAWRGAKVMVPTKFVAGDLDTAYYMAGADEYVTSGGMKKDVPLLEEVVLLEGVAHFLNQEKPDVINKLIIDFIKKF
ncbi:putative soluble epoxide hydrolase [Helianthus annuus]|nr:putative soluble epoxide hydrolase [Helianthus annuus]KAJ0737436.1 putative soluble epoxide hydrolase [Helianthus annuus]